MDSSAVKGDRTLGKTAVPVWALLPALLLVLAAALPLWMLVSRPSDPREGSKALSPAAFEAETGVRPLRVSLAGAGGLVQFSYQVVDPDKAISVHSQKSPTVLVDEKSGEPISKSWHGHAKRQALRPGGTYYFLFLNEGGVLRPGGTVAVRIGDSRLEHVPVR